MPLSLQQIDSNYPPTWPGTPATGVPYVNDPSSASGGTGLRFINGQDPVNYFTHQRSEGDLFKRDLEVYKGIKQLTDYIGSRTGIILNLPATILEPVDGSVSHSITIGRVPLSSKQSPHLYMVAADIICNPIPGGSSATASNAVLQLVDQYNSVIFSRNAGRNAALTIVGISATGSTAVITLSGSGLMVGDALVISGATNSANNGVYPITGAVGNVVTISEASPMVSQASGGSASAAYFLAAGNTDRGPSETGQMLSVQVVNTDSVEMVVNASLIWLSNER